MRRINQQIANYLYYCEKVRRMAPTTMRVKENTLKMFVTTTGISNLRMLTNEVFNDWMTSLINRGVTPRSVNTYNATILAMIRYHCNIGLNIPLQLSLIGKLHEGALKRRFYSSKEIKTVISQADFETSLMIEIMFETGMRIAELTYLKVSDFNGRRIQFIGKGRKPREVYIHRDTLRKLCKFLQEKKTNGYLFATLNGEPPTVATIRKRLQKPFLMAGFEGFYPHALRHSFATNLQLKGASVAEIKEMMGHESIATTERYLHGFEGKLEELFDKYG